MIYIKIDNGASVEALENPTFVCNQSSSGLVIRCHQVFAQGILSADGCVIYQLEGKDPVWRSVATATIITESEYLELVNNLDQPDIEDAEPVIPEGVDEVEIMTRAELTEKVKELDEAMELLLSGVTE